MAALTFKLSALIGSLVDAWVFAERACSRADSWGTAGAAQKWWMLCLPRLSNCSVKEGEGERRGRGRREAGGGEREGEGRGRGRGEGGGGEEGRERGGEEGEEENVEDSKGHSYWISC